jgi:NAD(P)-dependent dehydrogenase (short-subunit alcohol dehydrogenase family)
MSDTLPRGAQPRLRLPDRHVAITGAGGGIGGALARAAADEGAVVSCLDIDLATATACAQRLVSLGATAHPIHCDITDPASVASALASCIELGGPVDALFANAGGARGAQGPFLELTPEQWTSVVELNLTGSFLSGQAFARHMAERGRGSIVFTASQIGMVAYDQMAHYCSAKAGIIELVRCMAAELAAHGVRVNAIAPGPVLTERLRAAVPNSPALAALVTRIPLQRMAEPEEITGAAIYLASDDSSFTTGTTIVVDGGYVAL